MASSQLLLLVVGGLTLAAAALITAAVLRHAPRSRAADELGRGRFGAALAAAGALSEARLPAAVAARHLLELERAAELLDAHLREDPGDGEALLERGLLAAYAGHHHEAEAYLERAAAARADLGESITLHLAWLELRRGDAAAARRRFEEVETTIESKLRADLGGDPLFAEWFLHAALLWRAAGDRERAEWAWREGLAAAPESRLAEALSGDRARADGG